MAGPHGKAGLVTTDPLTGLRLPPIKREAGAVTGAQAAQALAKRNGMQFGSVQYEDVSISGWWFGTCVVLHILGIITPTD
jgi:hypothetical protein